jgi:hypothetical protein
VGRGARRVHSKFSVVWRTRPAPQHFLDAREGGAHSRGAGLCGAVCFGGSWHGRRGASGEAGDVPQAALWRRGDGASCGAGQYRSPDPDRSELSQRPQEGCWRGREGGIAGLCDRAPGWRWEAWAFACSVDDHAPRLHYCSCGPGHRRVPPSVVVVSGISPSPAQRGQPSCRR